MKTKRAILIRVAALTLALFGASAIIPAHAAKSYPLDTCVVSGNKLGSMGKVITKTHEGQEVKFCCKPCIKKFDKDPAKYVGKLK
jgi:YHS domain-containing protein